jgi:hypothetical protein
MYKLTIDKLMQSEQFDINAFIWQKRCYNICEACGD